MAGYRMLLRRAGTPQYAVRLCHYGVHGCRRGGMESPWDPDELTQREAKRKLNLGEPRMGMTAKWAARLTALEFTWDPKVALWEA